MMRGIERLRMFRSARVKLTLFYLATLLAFSLTLTVGIRMFAEYELNKSFTAQQGEFHQLAQNGLSLLVPHPEDDFQDAQTYHARVARHNLNKDLAILNLVALVIGGLVSYWFAGRTLKPIAEVHEAQARFVADASHELRTPLANIRAENEVFLRANTHAATFDAVETRELIQSNLEEVQRLEHLSRDLLALSQYSQTELTMEPVAVKTAIHDAIAQTDKTLEARSVTVKRQLAPGSVRANQESLVRLLVILLDNAVKYGPTGGKIYIAGAQHASYYVITLRDEGPGIADKDLPHIFERLYRGDPARANTTSGYGLGLALAQEIVEAHNGSLKAYNASKEQGSGAVFSLQLPLAKV
jgi:two-component system, OmpR family, sensor histidine kinase CiaH